jgi:hypothetical protein
VAAPLYGSGTCALTKYDEKTGDLEIVSEGPLVRMTATGKVDASGLIKGTYRAEYPSLPAQLPESGTFTLSFVQGRIKPLQLSDVLTFERLGGADDYQIAIRDRDMVSLHGKDGAYVGTRLLLDQNDSALLLIDDGPTSSVMRDPKTQSVVLTWLRTGDDGVFIRPEGERSVYLDRFLQPTGWSSVEVNNQTLFGYEANGTLELFDGKMQPLGVRRATTTEGSTYWSVTSNGITQYYDSSFKALGWSSFESDGKTYFARSLGHDRYAYYDENLRPLELPRREGSRTSLAQGIVAGLVAAGESMASAAQRPASAPLPGSLPFPTAAVVPTYAPNAYSSSTTTTGGVGFTHTRDSYGNAYTTTSSQLGRFRMSNTTGTNGYWANSATQTIGPFDYTQGYSTRGNFSGTRQRIGNFDYSRLTTPSGTWSGTSNQIGNITFHNYTGPNGQPVTGTSMKIGDFIFTNVQ